MQGYGTSNLPEKLTTEFLLTRQDETNGCELFLMQQGLFFHAYNQCAALFHHVTNYQVRMVKFRGHDIEQLGIPCSTILGALNRFESHFPSAVVESIGPHYHITIDKEDADSIPYEHNIHEDFSKRIRKPRTSATVPAVSPAVQKGGTPALSPSSDPIRDRLRSVNLVETTPLQAITILSDLISLL